MQENPSSGAIVLDLFSSSVKTQASQAYLNHLTTLDLEILTAEPSALQTQSHHLTSSLTSLTHTSYPAFISLHDTTTALTSSLDSFCSSLGSLINDSLPALEEASSSWLDRTDTVLNERRKARVVLEQHDKIRDLLDIPLLIDTCVRNGYFSEALSLANHAKSVTASYSTASDKTPLILTSVLSEVHNSMNHMLVSLLSTLHEPNRKLPALWKAVNFLRKMDAFKAPIGCKRDIMRLVGAGSLTLEERDKEDLTRYMKKYIDLWREGVYDILTQYSSIFLEHPESKSADSIPPSPDLLLSLRALLAAYTSRAFHSHLLPLLSPNLILSNFPLPSLPSLLTQLTYCATAFARVGMDFRGILGGLFSEAILTIVTREIQSHTKIWVDTLVAKMGSKTQKRTSVITTRGNTNSSTLPSKWMVTSSAAASPPTPTAKTISASPAHVAPSILTSYPPLANHTNAILTTLNNLRMLAPMAIYHDVLNLIDSELAHAGEALVAYAKKVLEDLAQASVDQTEEKEKEAQSEEKIAFAVTEVYFRVWVPFIRRAVGEGVFGLKRDYHVAGAIETTKDEGIDEVDNVRSTSGGMAADGRDEERKGVVELMRVIREWESWLKNNAYS
ncbi:Dor1-domain-containing protein [Dendrothele bispora CBS 962.96]|uniref:Conserved oligomeric Golgi complex subunit 8 n=1 Tax=Dendrothele bispora (strain CBS 962.96) TaxID=1314807 RepID=A0A4S8LFM8_DENBC|nr:Dor1-domain-containing protein [Dendrothele bispora CBS 962.96]